MIEEED